MGDLPEFHVPTLLHPLDESWGVSMDCCNDRAAGVKESGDSRPETLREAFHPADLIDQVDVDSVIGSKGALGNPIQGLDIDPVLSDSVRRSDVSVREDGMLSIDGLQAEPHTLPFVANLIRDKAADSAVGKCRRDRSDQRRLSDAGFPGEEKRACGMNQT